MMKFGKQITVGVNVRARRHRRLLDEFLEKKFAQRLAKQGNGAQEETSSQDFKTKVTIPDDLLFKIFILVPTESLLRLQFVCKRWFNLINSSVFIKFHAQQSQTVLLSQELTLLEPGSRAALNTLLPEDYEDKLKSYFHFLDLDNGIDDFIESSVVELVDIWASFDGLVLATTLSRNNGLILMNPMTRKHTMLPLGTMIANSCDESYGIVFCNEAKAYKIVHLFCEKQGKTGCEILSICTRKWSRIEGPPCELSRYIEQIFVSVGGSLHLLPSKQGFDHFVSLSVHDEKFVTNKLPVTCGAKDRLVEIGASLGFVVHAENDLLQVWILAMNDAGSGVNWEKRYSINLSGDVKYLVPISSSRNGKEVVLESPLHHCYVYNFDRGEMRQVHLRDDDDDDDEEAWFEWAGWLYIPHRNTLVSWE